MGLKKNSPGCNCCDTCLNDDPTEYVGITVSGAPVITSTCNGVSTPSLDVNGTYLWAASNLTSPPTTMRLGRANQCAVQWSSTTTGDTSGLGVTIPWTCSGSLSVYMSYSLFFDLDMTVTTTSLAFSLRYWVEIEYRVAASACITDVTSTIKRSTVGFDFYNFGRFASPARGGFSTPFSVTNSNSGSSLGRTFSDSKTFSGRNEPFQVVKNPAFTSTLFGATQYPLTYSVSSGSSHTVTFDAVT